MEEAGVELVCGLGEACLQLGVGIFIKKVEP
jgi:hypothetical protein